MSWVHRVCFLSLSHCDILAGFWQPNACGTLQFKMKADGAVWVSLVSLVAAATAVCVEKLLARL